MAESNWDLAYRHSRGDYVMFLGDDDGLMPYALRELDALLRRSQVPAITWNWAVYAWPDVAVSGMANYLKVGLERRGPSRLARFDHRRPGRARRRGNPSKCLPQCCLPGRPRARACRGGPSLSQGSIRIPSPASQSRFLIDRHLSVTVPMTVIGVSGTSNGIATILLRGKHPVAREFREANARRGTSIHPSVPDLPIMWAVIADSFLTAKSALFPNDERLTLDRRQLAEHCVAAMPADRSAEQRSVMDIVREHCKTTRSWWRGWTNDTVPSCRQYSHLARCGRRDSVSTARVFTSTRRRSTYRTSQAQFASPATSWALGPSRSPTNPSRR